MVNNNFMGNIAKYGLNKAKILRIIFLVLADIIVINLVSFLSIFMLYEFDYAALVQSGVLNGLLKYSVVNTAVSLIVFAALRLYNSLWEYAGAEEMYRIIMAVTIAQVLQVFGMYIAKISMPISYPFVSAMLLVLFLFSMRFSYRSLRHIRSKSSGAGQRKRTMLIGAGSAGVQVLREFEFSRYSNNNVVCIIDDDKRKIGQYLQKVKIVGDKHSIPWAVEKYNVEEIILAIPTITSKQKRKILDICQKTPCTLKTLPGIYQLANGEVSLQDLRSVNIEDLLGRDSVKVNLDEIANYVSGKTVLVTGGGGSIGSELCRQVAKHKPKKIIIFDIYENSAYGVQQELLTDHPHLDLEVLIGSVRDEIRMEEIFCQYHPDIVYHAAAHKHVPLMEDSPREAIKNNVFGTYNTAKMADKYNCGTFVLISTDKAVNPTSIMGASKRICEIIMQSFAKKSKTKFAAVRFGNVLGSNGSVIPLFEQQIKNGGPVTVTHKDIIRYFMTIPEAVSLVLQTGAYACGGEIFILDMGEPVKIDDLARNMIKLSGLEPDVDIKIEYTGLRPGEKLFEELLLKEEGIQKTDNDLIYIGHPIVFNEQQLNIQLDNLKAICYGGQGDIKKAVMDIVEQYNAK